MPIQLSGSLVITGSITTTGVITMSGSIASASYSSTSDLLQGTGSVGFTTTASFNAVSSSQQQVSASYIALSASYNIFSGSASTRITVDSASLLQVSASQQQISASLLNVIAIGATTGSNSFRANQSITGSLTVTGQIIAQTLNVQQVTSSIIYSSGSNNFGCDLNSRQTFTGSVLITGSLTIAGASSATSYSGTTIYGSTAVCSAVGKFTTCLDLGGALTGTSGTFSSCVTATQFNVSTSGGTTQIYNTGGGHTVITNATANKDMNIQTSGTGAQYFNTAGADRLTIASTGIACFACQVCAPNLLISNCATIGTVGFSYPEFRLAVTPIMTVVGAGCTPTSEGIYFKRTSNLCQGGWISGNGGALYLVGQNKHATAFGNIYFSSNDGTTTCDIMVIDGVNQRVGIGTTTPYAKFEVLGGNQCPPSAGTQNYTMALRDPTSMVCGVGGSILFQGYKTGTAAIGNFAYIAGKKENGTAGNEAGYISLGNFDSAGNAAERMRITCGGDVLMGYGNIGSLLIRQTVAGTVDNNSQSIGNNGINYMNRVSGVGLHHIFFNNGNNIVGTITSCTTATQFNTTSDYRLKTDLKNYNGICLINQIKTYDFAWKLNDARTYGVIAHELSDVIPYAVTGEKDALDERGCILPQAVDYSKIVTPLIKAVQEQQCTICSQATIINTLKTCLGIA